MHFSLTDFIPFDFDANFFYTLSTTQLVARVVTLPRHSTTGESTVQAYNRYMIFDLSLTSSGLAHILIDATPPYLSAPHPTSEYLSSSLCMALITLRLVSSRLAFPTISMDALW